MIPIFPSKDVILQLIYLTSYRAINFPIDIEKLYHYMTVNMVQSQVFGKVDLKKNFFFLLFINIANFIYNIYIRWLSIGSDDDDVCILQLIYEHGGGSAVPAQRQS